jgi:hypothetical protein
MAEQPPLDFPLPGDEMTANNLMIDQYLPSGFISATSRLDSSS